MPGLNVRVRRWVAEAVLRVAPADYLMRKASARLGISSIGVDGMLGHFQGSARDGAVVGSYLLNHTWAPELQELFARILGGGGTLVDVGANIGLTSIPISRIPGVRCFAFEPDPENYRYLVSNVAWNGVTGVKPFNVAIMANEGTLQLERSTDNWGDHRIRLNRGEPGPYGEEMRSTVEVQARRLDRILENEVLASPVLLKVDTQGAEVQVLRSASGILPRMDWAVLEYWPYGLRRMGDTPEGFHEFVSTFSHGAILGDAIPTRLVPVAELVAEMHRRVPENGSSVEHLDIVVGRVPALP